MTVGFAVMVDLLSAPRPRWPKPLIGERSELLASGGRIGRREVGEDVGRRHRRPVHAVADARPVAGVDEQRVEGVHHVVVERSAPARLVRASLEHRPFDLEAAVLGVRLRDVHHQVVVEQQLGQRVGAVRAERPVRLAVQAVDRGEVGVQPGAVGAAVVLAHVEGVFQVVEIADLQIAVDLVELLHRHDHVLDLGAAEPLDADRELAGDHRLADHGEQRRPGCAGAAARSRPRRRRPGRSRRPGCSAPAP